MVRMYLIPNNLLTSAILRKENIAAKTSKMIEFLKNHTYSASSINMYLRNPMEFYMNYVLGLREHEDLLDEPDARHVGTFIHELLEEEFKPFLGKKPNIDQKFQKRFMKNFEDRFGDYYQVIRHIGSTIS